MSDPAEIAAQKADQRRSLQDVGADEPRRGWEPRARNWLSDHPGWPVAAFLGVRHEPDTRPFLEDLLAEGRRVYLPTMAPGGSLRMAALRALDVLEEAAFGLLEPPVPARDELLGRERRALVLVPGLAFDRTGTRLGHGRGHYDRWFEQATALKLLCVGLTTDARVVEGLTSGPHDRRMDGVLTCSGWALQPRK